MSEILSQDFKTLSEEGQRDYCIRATISRFTTQLTIEDAIKDAEKLKKYLLEGVK